MYGVSQVLRYAVVLVRYMLYCIWDEGTVTTGYSVLVHGLRFVLHDDPFPSAVVIGNARKLLVGESYATWRKLLVL